MAIERLPIYFLIDVCGGMNGEPIQRVKDEIRHLLVLLKASDVSDCAWVSVITFGNEALLAVPLTPLAEFDMPELEIGGGSAFGPALSLLAECRKRECVTSTAERAGDRRPYIFAFVNGGCLVGNLEQGVNELKRQIWSRFVCIASGPDANIDILKHIRPSSILYLQELQHTTLAKCFGWITGGSSWWPPRFRQMEDDESSLDSAAIDGLPPLPPEMGIL